MKTEQHKAYIRIPLKGLDDIKIDSDGIIHLPSSNINLSQAIEYIAGIQKAIEFVRVNIKK